ncbi:hypothetical protein ACIRBZ_01880 [Streptomyces sp. NPDC094038]|uniref:hypothetical protein n=1 Tax=Streptomyces sp. NPDC094038 TaxID=3366055 RepID=UPI0037F79FC3
MKPTPFTLLLLALGMAVLLSALVSVVTIALARWNGAALPAALIQGGIAFAGSLTLCCAMLAFLSGSPR